MKKFIFLFAGLLSSWVINSQILNYSDAALLFSDQQINGSARFNALSGAFGALGGDLSAADINPAGIAVFNDSEASFTLGNRNTDVMTTFYADPISNQNDYFNLIQAGGVLLLNGISDSKIALGFNYSLSRDFKDDWISSGISDISPLLDYYDPDFIYEFIDNQSFRNHTDGRNDKLVISIGSFNGDNLYLGASVNTHSIDFRQDAIVGASAHDANDNYLTVAEQARLDTQGSGFSIGLGAIIKPSHETRIGLAFESPTWYTLSEYSALWDNDGFIVSENAFDYNLKTPSRFTGSFAYVIGKEGLLSFDYNYKTYKNIKLKPTGDFTVENSDFNTYLKNTSSFAVGGEWRLDNLSLRGGYHFEESPYKDALDSDHVQGYSLGLGFKFNRNLKLDVAYQRDNHTGFHDFSVIDDVQRVELETTNKKLTATLVLGF
ncbi:MAG: outer membrane protein transport protein [Flavobacteriaceae bacterium]|nr:outer membrane protein transport protein [Flavobacteriaceae bacterium]